MVIDRSKESDIVQEYKEYLNNSTIDILGEKYTIITNDSDYFKVRDADGTCEWLSKKIYIDPDAFVIEADTLQDLIKNVDAILMHEIIHAFLFESGMKDYERDEVIVEWISRFVNKIQTSINSLKKDNESILELIKKYSTE